MSRHRARIVHKILGALGERAPKDKIAAHCLDVHAGSDQIEIPGPVRGIAEQHSAGEPVVGDHQLLVKVDAGVAEHDLLGAVATEEIASRKDIYARDLQVGSQYAAVIARIAPNKPLGKHARLLVGWFNQSVADAAMLGTFADRVDAWDIRLKVVVD